MKHKVTVVNHYLCEDCGDSYDTRFQAENCECEVDEDEY